MIVLADRDAAADHRHVALDRLGGGFAGRSTIISDPLRRRYVRSARSCEGDDRDAVRIPYLTRQNLGGRIDQLVSGADHRNAGSPAARHRVAPDGCQNAKLRGTERRAGCQDSLPRPNVLPASPDVPPGLDPLLCLDLPVSLGRVLLGEDGVRLRRKHRAGCDSDRLTGPDAGPGGTTGPGLIHDAERHRIAGTGCCGVLGAQGEAVHRRVVEGRDGDVASHLIGQGAAQRLLQGHLLGRKWRAAFDHDSAGLGEPDQLPRH